MSDKTIAFCMAAGDRMHTACAVDFANCYSYTSRIGHRVMTNHMSSSILAEVRQNLCRTSIEAGASHIFMFDSDARFPKYAVDRLLEWDKPVVSVNASKRKRPVGPTARKKNLFFGDNTETESVWPDPEKLDLEEVETVGMHMMLIRTDVFFELEYPWFSMPFVEQADKWVGEDVFFCGRLKEAGVPLYIDHGLSWEVKHIGDYEFGMRDVLDERTAVEAGLWEGKDG